MPLSELSSTTLADQAYEALRAAIVSGELPWGERITERGLAARLGVSATPVREALRRLEQERLVERTGPRSLRVANMTADARAESSELEAALEGVAAKLAARKISERSLDQLDDLLDAADAQRAELLADDEAGRTPNRRTVETGFDRLREFHALIEAAAGNEQLLNMLAQARAFSHDQRLAAANELIDAHSESLHARYDDHRRLAQALRARDEQTAEHLARSHALTAAADLLLTTAPQPPTEAPSPDNPPTPELS
jgi:DNA-binding GntR family transcriptional regulator